MCEVTQSQKHVEPGLSLKHMLFLVMQGRQRPISCAHGRSKMLHCSDLFRVTIPAP